MAFRRPLVFALALVTLTLAAASLLVAAASSASAADGRDYISMVGSSRNNDDTSGEAPTMSPADTTAWCGDWALRAAMALAK